MDDDGSERNKAQRSDSSRCAIDRNVAEFYHLDLSTPLIVRDIKSDPEDWRVADSRRRSGETRTRHVATHAHS